MGQAAHAYRAVEQPTNCLEQQGTSKGFLVSFQKIVKNIERVLKKTIRKMKKDGRNAVPAR